MRVSQTTQTSQLLIRRNWNLHTTRNTTFHIKNTNYRIKFHEFCCQFPHFWINPKFQTEFMDKQTDRGADDEDG